MRVADLSLSELRASLANMGIYIRTGPFVCHIQSDIPSVATGVGLLYSDYPLDKHAQFADFHVALRPPHNVRRWFKPQVLFLFDGENTFKPLPYNQAFPMLEWGLNWCISGHAHRYLIIHAAVIEKNGCAAILPAPPGSGKSTLCAALIHRGWRLLSDELTLIDTVTGNIVPVPRPVSLKNQSIDIIQAFEPNSVFNVRVSDTVKGTVAHMKPPQASILNAEQTARPAWIVFPKYQKDAATELTPIPSARAFIRVAENAFNYSTLGTLGFHTMAHLIEHSLCYDFRYSILDEAIETFHSLANQVANER